MGRKPFNLVLVMHDNHNCMHCNTDNKGDTMTEKRYYQQRYEEEYYIFDSEKISEKEFEEKLEIEGYKAFEDSLTGEEVVKLLNENEQLKKENHGIQDKVIRLLDYVEVKQCVTRTEIKKWWNGDVE